MVASPRGRNCGPASNRDPDRNSGGDLSAAFLKPAEDSN
jgi:hypothetical protein